MRRRTNGGGMIKCRHQPRVSSGKSKSALRVCRNCGEKIKAHVSKGALTWVISQKVEVKRSSYKDGRIGMLTRYRRELDDAIIEVGSKKRKQLLEHFVERAFIDDTALIALMKKMVPDLKAIDLTTEGKTGWQVIVVNFADAIKKKELEDKEKD